MLFPLMRLLHNVSFQHMYVLSNEVSADKTVCCVHVIEMPAHVIEIHSSFRDSIVDSIHKGMQMPNHNKHQIVSTQTLLEVGFIIKCEN